MNRWLLWLPLVVFGLLLALALNSLTRQDGEGGHIVRSRMVGQALPALSLPAIVPGKPGVAPSDFTTGQPRLLNLFASWCVPCAVEAPQLARMKAAGVVIVGVAVKDQPAELQDFLARHGDPYAAVGSDPNSGTLPQLGASGVPESFVIDGRGRIVAQHIGPIRDADVPELLAALERAK